MDIKTYIDSFKDNIKFKTSNPFFGSLIIVWLFHNWRFAYKLFNFSSDDKVEQRVDFIASYLDPPNFLPNLAWCISISFVVLIASYSLLYLSRLIINFYENIVGPFVYRITDKGSVVLKTDYVLLKAEKEQLNDRLDAERLSRVSLQKELDESETKFAKLQSEYNELNKKAQRGPFTRVNGHDTGVEVELNDVELNIMKILATERDDITIDDLNLSTKNMVKTKHFVTELIQKGLIKDEFSNEYSTELYLLTDLGRAYMVNKGLV